MAIDEKIRTRFEEAIDRLIGHICEELIHRPRARSLPKLVMIFRSVSTFENVPSRSFISEFRLIPKGLWTLTQREQTICSYYGGGNKNDEILSCISAIENHSVRQVEFNPTNLELAIYFDNEYIFRVVENYDIKSSRSIIDLPRAVSGEMYFIKDGNISGGGWIS